MTPLSLQSRIVLVLTLTACTVQPQNQSAAPAASEVPGRVVEQPDALPTPATPEPISLQAWVGHADMLGDVSVRLIGEPGTTVLVFASDTPGSDVAAGLEVDLVDPVAVASVVLEPSPAGGVAKISAPHLMELAPGETLYVQAVSVDGTWRTPVLVEPVRRFERTCQALSTTALLRERVVCDTQAIVGQCPAPNALLDPLVLAARTLGDGPVAAQAVCQEVNATGSCCYQMVVEYEETAAEQPIDTGFPWDAGRPFRVDGEARQAELERPVLGEARDEAIAAGWAAMAREEHASVAAFARFSMELMHLGAPMDLVRDACKAQLDEAHHAELTLALASEFAGRPLKLSGIAIDGALEGRDLRTITMDVVREGCINETVSTVIAMVARDGASHRGARDALAVIADDEARHSELAWRFVAWAVQQDPELRAEVMAELNGFRPEVKATPSKFSAVLAEHGVLDARATQDAAFRAGQMIRKCASSLS